MILQLVIADSLSRYKRSSRRKFYGKDQRKRTPVRIVFGDPKRNCKGYGLCKVDLGDHEVVDSHCRGGRVEYGILLSELNSDIFYLVISRGNWERYGYCRELQEFAPQFLNIPLALAQEIGLHGTRVIVEPPKELTF